jgi:hypothetical protein
MAFAVRVASATGGGPWGSPPPAPPVILSPTNDAVTTTATISGTTALGTSVEVFDAGVSVGFAAVTGTSWTITPTLGDGTHVITAQASHGANVSAPSIPVTFVLDTTPPAPPSGLAGATPTTAPPALSWLPVPDAVQYEVLRDGAPAGMTPNVAFTDAGVPAGAATYGYAVRSIDAVGNVGAPCAAVAIAFDDTWPANVLVVGAGGFADVGAALAAASGLDAVIMVTPGIYSSFDVPPSTAGNVRIVGAGPGAVTIDTSASPIRLLGVSAPALVEMSDVVVTPPVAGHPAMVVQGCTAVVVLDEVVVSGGLDAGIAVAASPRVVVQRSTVTGSPGLRADQGSFVSVVGGALSTADILGASRVRCAGLSTAATTAAGCVFETLAGVAPFLDAPEFANAGSVVTIAFSGAPAAEWVLATSGATGYDFVLDPAPQAPGVVLLGMPIVLVAVGVTDAAGLGSIAIQLPAHPHYLGRPLVLQAAGVDPVLVAYRLSNAVSVVGLP